MKDMKCKYSVEYYDHYYDDNYYYIIMEKCDEDLNDLFQKNNFYFSDSLIKKIFLQLNEDFKKMHSLKIIHRDLKPANILIKYDSTNSNDFTIKLGDFGISRKFDNIDFTTQKGTQGFFAPELISKPYDPNKCDLWAIGVILYFFKFNNLPFILFYQGKIPNNIDNKLLDDLVKKLIVVDPTKRISWEDYFNHPFFK